VEIIAHRGASFDAPENTLASIRLAWKQNADAVEVDAHLSRDNRVVIVHDADTYRIAGIKKLIREHDLADLQKLDVGKWKAKQWAGERLACLEDALSLIPPGKRMLVEIKSGPDTVTPFRNALEGSGVVTKQVAAIGFELATMSLFKRTVPEIEVYWVQGFKRDWRRGGWTPKPAELIRDAKEAAVDGLDVGANGPLSASFVKKVKAAGLKFYVWTVDSPAKARALQAAGVDGIATNRPGYMREKLDADEN